MFFLCSQSHSLFVGLLIGCFANAVLQLACLSVCLFSHLSVCPCVRLSHNPSVCLALLYEVVSITNWKVFVAFGTLSLALSLSSLLHSLVRYFCAWFADFELATMNGEFIVNVFVRLSVLRLMIRVKSCLPSLAKSKAQKTERTAFEQAICYLLWFPWIWIHFIEFLWLNYWHFAS